MAARLRLDQATVEGDMRDLSEFADGSFDLVFHPSANLLIPDIRSAWRTSFRVLRPQSRLPARFVNPVAYVSNCACSEKGEVVVRHAVPYSDLTSLGKEKQQRWLDAGQPLRHHLNRERPPLTLPHRTSRQVHPAECAGPGAGPSVGPGAADCAGP